MKVVYVFSQKEREVFSKMKSMLVKQMGWYMGEDATKDASLKAFVETCPGDIVQPFGTISEYREWMRALKKYTYPLDDESIMDLASAHRRAVNHKRD